MNKKTIITALLALVAMAGQAQNQVSIQGIVQPEVKTVYVFRDLSFRNPDSITVTNGRWEYRPATIPMLQSLCIFMSDKAYKQQDLDGFAAAVNDTIPSFVDLTKGTVTGSKVSVAMNKTVKGLLVCMKNNTKEEAFRIMRKAVMDNLDSMLPLVFVPMIADGLSFGDLQRIFYSGAPYADQPRMEGAKERLALLSGQYVRSIGKPFIDLAMNDTIGNEHRLRQRPLCARRFLGFVVRAMSRRNAKRVSMLREISPEGIRHCCHLVRQQKGRMAACHQQHEDALDSPE